MQKIILLQPVSTGKLAQDLKLAPSFVLKKLKKLEKTGAIEQNGRVALNRSIIWKVKGRKLWMDKPIKTLILGSGALQIGQAGESRVWL